MRQSCKVSVLLTPSPGICSPAGAQTEQQILLHMLHICETNALVESLCVMYAQVGLSSQTAHRMTPSEEEAKAENSGAGEVSASKPADLCLLSNPYKLRNPRRDSR